MSSVYSAQVSREAVIPRKCDHCGFEYSTRKFIVGSCLNNYSESGAQEKAQREFDKRVEKFTSGQYELRTIGVLCPACEQFSKASIQLHFSNGIPSGIADLVAKALNMSRDLRKERNVTIGVFVTCVVLAVIACLYAFPAEGEKRIGLFAVAGVLSLFASLLPLLARRQKRKMAEIDQLESKLGRLSEEQLQNLLVQFYQHALETFDPSYEHMRFVPGCTMVGSRSIADSGKYYDEIRERMEWFKPVKLLPVVDWMLTDNMESKKAAGVPE